ncbi:MAG: MATE family efflux transporter [Bacteroidales bacterium]|nr:MATE family efflux transporter [Bacteroidales bacterium]
MPAKLDFIETPIPQLIKKLAIPTSVGFLFNTMFNVVDTYFAGQISTFAQAGLAISFPVFFIILSVGMGIGTGTTALISNALGRRDEETAKIFARQALVFGFLLSVLLSVIGYLSVPYLFKFMSAEGETLTMALEYMNVVLICTVTFLLNGILNGILSSRGDTMSFRNFLVAGSILNIGLDPLLMYGAFGIPGIGISGIALATVLIQGGGVLYMGYRVRRTELFAQIEPELFVPDKKYFAEIAKQGFPASINMMTIAVGIFIITWFISRFGDAGVAAYGIATRIEQIALLPTIGLNIAALTIIGQNYGAGHINRVIETYRKSLKFGAIIMSFGMVWVFLLSHYLVGLFTTDQEVIEIGALYLQIAVIIFNAYVLMNISVAVLQGLKKPMFAIWIGLFRQVLMPVLLFSLLAEILGFELLGIWWGLVIINWTAAIISVLFTLRKLKTLSS